jgi:hypothetical protein
MDADSLSYTQLFLNISTKQRVFSNGQIATMRINEMEFFEILAEETGAHG